MRRRLCGDLVATFQGLKGTCEEDGEGPFIKNCSDRARSNGFKLKEGKFRFILKESFTMRVVRHWEWLPKRVVDATSLDVQDHVGWGSEQPEIMETCPSPWQGAGMRSSLSCFPIQTILLSHDSMKLKIQPVLPGSQTRRPSGQSQPDIFKGHML